MIDRRKTSCASLLALTLLLAVPTGPRPRRVRAEDGTIDDPATTFDPEGDDD